VETQKQY